MPCFVLGATDRYSVTKQLANGKGLHSVILWGCCAVHIQIINVAYAKVGTCQGARHRLIRPQTFGVRGGDVPSVHRLAHAL